MTTPDPTPPPTPGGVGSSPQDRQSAVPISRQSAEPTRGARPAGEGGTAREEHARGLAVHELVVHYRDDDGTVALAVDHVSLDVAPGEILALLGPSGSGKSTLLRAIAGLERPTSGRITWDSRDLADVPVHRRGFGLMFQDGQLFAHRTVARNVSFGLEMARIPRQEQRARVAELLEVVGLAGFGDRDVASLSGGERQRVALARALAPRPRLLLLDEPLSALDRALREHLAAEVRTALKATGTAAVFVTHDHDEAFAVADRIAVLDDARLLQVDTPVQLWRRPATVRVAQFLGFEVFVPAADHEWLVGAPGTALVGAPGEPASPGRADAVVGGVDPDASRLPGEPTAAAGEGAVVGGQVLAVGPGALRLADDGPWSGHVVASGFRRGVTHTAVAVEGVGEVTVLGQEPVLIEPGSPVRLDRSPDLST